jgi:hypothetical protein
MLIILIHAFFASPMEESHSINTSAGLAWKDVAHSTTSLCLSSKPAVFAYSCLQLYSEIARLEIKFNVTIEGSLLDRPGAQLAQWLASMTTNRRS